MGIKIWWIWMAIAAFFVIAEIFTMGFVVLLKSLKGLVVYGTYRFPPVTQPLDHQTDPFFLCIRSCCFDGFEAGSCENGCVLSSWGHHSIRNEITDPKTDSRQGQINDVEIALVI